MGTDGWRRYPRALERIKHPSKLPSRLDEPDACDVSFVVLFDGWVDDLERFHRSVAAHTDENWEIVVVDNPVDEAASERIASFERVEHVPLRDHVGYGAGRNLGLRTATGRIVCIVDTSVELVGDISRPLIDALSDPGVGLVGRWGLTTTNGYDFVESSGPDVDGVEAYLMAMRRSDLARTGLFDPKFAFYRNADLDFTYQVRAAGLRTIVDPSVPAVRHEHRQWATTPAEKRDELSRRNFFRFRKHWY